MGLIPPFHRLTEFHLLRPGEVSKSWEYEEKTYLGFEAAGKQIPAHSDPSPVEGSLKALECLCALASGQTFLSS